MTDAMPGAARRIAAARRVVASAVLPPASHDDSEPDDWTATYTEHKIDTIIYEHDEEDEHNPINIGMPPVSSSSSMKPTGAGEASGGAAFTGLDHGILTRQTSLKNVYEAKDEKRVIIVCHDEESNEIPCPGATSSVGSQFDTPSSSIDDSLHPKKETNSLLIEVSDKLNSMPKHHPIILTNSIPTDDEAFTDSLKMKYRSKPKGEDTPDLILSDSEEDGSSEPMDVSVKRRIYQRKLGATQPRVSLDDGSSISSNMLKPPKELTLSVPNLHTLSVSGHSTPRGPRPPRISHSPRLTPKPSPRLSPRLAHTVHNVKKKISEAMKHEMAFLVSVNRPL